MAKSIKLLTIADGFGDNSIHPDGYTDYFKWPEIIRLMTRGVELINLSRYGAGNEYIVNSLRNNVNDKDCVLIQWAQPNRLDLIIHDQYNWADAIASDPVYNNNIIDVGLDQMWLSSGSKIKEIKEYHNKFISTRQHKLRSQLYIDYAMLLLEKMKIDYKFMLTTTSEYICDTGNWVWHSKQQGMHEFRYQSQYCELDFGYPQPIPLIQFDFIKQFIMPVVDLPWRDSRDIDAVESMLYRKQKNYDKN